MTIKAKQKPSLNHTNRRPHNWLIYDAYDRSLYKNTNYVRGNLYDLGAGESPYRTWLLQFATHYTAIDWGNSWHNTTGIIEADLNGPLPVESAVADTIVSFSVIEHLHNPQTMLSEARRILRPGGHLLLQVPWQWWVHEEPHDYFRFTPYGLRHLCANAGLEVLSVEAQAGAFTTIILKCNYLSLRLIRGPALIRAAIKLALVGPWAFLQLLAGMLDRLDRHWELEAPGYFLVARRPLLEPGAA